MQRLISFFIALLAITIAFENGACVSSQQSQDNEMNRPFKPFRIMANIYYVGTNDMACYLFTTPSGHILLDTGFEESAPIIKSNLATLGFKLSDIKIILSSHAHYDHVGGHANMKRDTGALVYASEKDAPILESGGTKTFFPLTAYDPVKVDRVFKDGETVQLDEVKLTAHIMPGHTEGNTAWTTTISEGGKTYAVVFVPSMSINPGVHFVNFPAWPNIADAYADSFRRLKQLQCDIFLGPHARFFEMEKKVQQLAQNPTSAPFIDPVGFKHYIDSLEEAFTKQLEKERKERQ